MSIVAVRAALETKLNAMTPAISTAWENLPYTPVAGTPYQAAYVMPASPDNSVLGGGYHKKQGIFQIDLMYPIQAGTATAAARAELIETWFKQGTSMTSGSVTVKIMKTPYVAQGRVEDDRWRVPIKITWQAEIFT